MTDERVEPTKEWMDGLIEGLCGCSKASSDKCPAKIAGRKLRDAILASQPERVAQGAARKKTVYICGECKLARSGPCYESMPSASERGEQCEDCDRFYGENGLVWRATDELWRLVGWGERGLLCPDCFMERVKNMGSTPYFAAVDRDTFSRLMAPQVECDEENHRYFREDNGYKFCPECRQSLKGGES